MRVAQLTVIRDGINRLRPKGGARADSLYDLVNAYVTAERTVVGRPGTRRAADLPAGLTVGLVAFESSLHVFAPRPFEAVQTELAGASGTYEVPDGVTSLQVLVVAGGGSGGADDTAGGGGGGGVVYDASYAVTPGESIAYTIGAGGAGSAVGGGHGNPGGDSTFGSITAIGGGAGGQVGDVATVGGSGGGGSGQHPGSATAGAAGTVDQGNEGGDGVSDAVFANDSGGGGGGAGAAGENGSALGVGGDGGAGFDGSAIFGTDVGDSGFFGGGGGGGSNNGTPGAGGAGGGGNGASTSGGIGALGQAFTGGGGGGGGTSSFSGGGGTIIVQYTPELPDGYELDILLHPFDPEAELVAIHYAAPFLGALYVVAEFDDGGIYHYWLQEGAAWEASTEIAANEFRTPTSANGFVYRATRLGQPYPAWTPGAPRTAGNGSSIEPSIIEPTEYNEYYYTAVETQGDTPASGTTEPPWPTESGARITESTDGFTFPNADAANPPTPPPPNTPQATTTERYEL